MKKATPKYVGQAIGVVARKTQHEAQGKPIRSVMAKFICKIKTPPRKNRNDVLCIKRQMNYQPKIQANINGATMVASLSTINLGVCISNLPHVIFSLGTAPE